MIGLVTYTWLWSCSSKNPKFMVIVDNDKLKSDPNLLEDRLLHMDKVGKHRYQGKGKESLLELRRDQELSD